MLFQSVASFSGIAGIEQAISNLGLLGQLPLCVGAPFPNRFSLSVSNGFTGHIKKTVPGAKIILDFFKK